MARRNTEKREETVAVAIDKDKSSQYALKWTVDHLLSRGQALTLLHVKQKTSSIPSPMGSFVSMSDVSEDVARTYSKQIENQAKDLFLPFRCFCTRKDIKCNEIILEESEIAKSLINYVSANSIEILVLGAPSRGGIVRRFKTTDVPSSVSKAAPDFCTVYVISKGKIASVRSASSSAPSKASAPPRNIQHQASNISDGSDSTPSMRNNQFRERTQFTPRMMPDEMEIRSPFTRPKAATNRSYELSPDSDISFVSSGRPSVDRMFPSFYDSIDSGTPPRYSTGSDFDLRSFASSNKSIDISVSLEIIG